MFSRFRSAALIVSGLVCSSSPAFAHVTLAGPGFAGQNQLLTFSIGHGCSGADTIKLEVTIPSEVASVRAMPNVFGDTQVKTNDAGLVTSVVWSKDKPRTADDQFYQMAIRIGVPDAAFTTLLFPATQTCRAADGTETVVNWSATPDDVKNAKAGEEPTPAPTLLVLPVRVPGWNKYTVKNAISDLSVFNDAQVVWAGNAAYSGNAATADLIKSEDGVDQLSELKAGSEIWVKY
jgi:periplasmic copper chaperone A